MIEAFKLGAPPHGGSAPGIDRIVMLLAGEEAIREVIAVPDEPERRRPDDGRAIHGDSCSASRIGAAGDRTAPKAEAARGLRPDFHSAPDKLDAIQRVALTRFGGRMSGKLGAWQEALIGCSFFASLAYRLQRTHFSQRWCHCLKAVAHA